MRGKFESFETIPQLFLKPSIPGPLPLRMRQRLAAIGAAIRLALQENELPVAELSLSAPSTRVRVKTSFTIYAIPLKESCAKSPTGKDRFSR